MKDIKRLLSFLGPYRKDLLIACAFVFIETSFELFIPALMADLIDNGVVPGDLGYMADKGMQMGLCAILALITGLMYARFAARAAYGWGARIREAEYRKIQEYAFSDIDKFETSSLVTRLTSDVTVMQNVINGGLRPLVRSPLLLVLGIGLSFSMNAELSIIFIVMTPILFCILFTILRSVADMDIRVVHIDLQRLIRMQRGCILERLPVQVNHIGRTGPLVIVIPVLRYDCHIVIPFEGGNRLMPAVRAPVNDHPSDRIEKVQHRLPPLPAIRSASAIPRLPVCNSLGINAVPQSSCTSESR